MSSPASKQLKEEVERQMSMNFNGTKSLKSVEVVGFTKGSVVATLHFFYSTQVFSSYFLSWRNTHQDKMFDHVNV